MDEADLKKLLLEFRDLVLRDVSQWKIQDFDNGGIGSNHHPIWPRIADAVGGCTLTQGQR